VTGRSRPLSWSVPSSGKSDGRAISRSWSDMRARVSRGCGR
jgi:hypothetical protein